MCPATATSDEHVPPRCLFPEKKDLPPGVDLRKRLITVRSCDVHNTRKSTDDEYLLYALTMNIPNNTVAENHFATKVMRAIGRNSSLIKRFAADQQPVIAEDVTTGNRQETVAVKIDERRLERGLELMSRALYFHHFKSQWPGVVKVYPTFLLVISEPDAREMNEPREEMAAYTAQLMASEPRHGENPGVFFYQLAAGQPPTEHVMRLTFYEGSHVTVLFKR